jgi:hypothetical protein
MALGQETSDGSGQFRIDAIRTSSATHHDVGIAALAPAYGVGWAALDVDAGVPSAEITLRPEQVIAGRLFDVQARPAEGVRVSVEAMGTPRAAPAPLREDLDGPHFPQGPNPRELPAWPRAAITNAEGRFTLHGIGRGLRVSLLAQDPRFARQRMNVDTNSPAGPKSLTVALEPARVIQGRVTYADTGKPLAHATVQTIAFREGLGMVSAFATDAAGWYRANPFSAERYAVSVYPADGEPYLRATAQNLAWTKGSLELRLDLALKRGTLLRGKVTEEGSGKPIAGAIVGHYGRSIGDEPAPAGAGNTDTQTGPEGTYQFAVLPWPGTLVVLGPSEDYVFQERGERLIREGEPGGRRWYAHAFVDCDLRSAGATHEVNVVLRRGVTVRARVVDREGQPVPEARIFSRLLTLPQPTPSRIWGGYHSEVRNGRCELHGLAPDAEVPVHFLDPRRAIGATVVFSGNQPADRSLTVRLEPCCSARARLVDAAGKPLAQYRRPHLVYLVVTPGAFPSRSKEAEQGRLWADETYLGRIDPLHYSEAIATDAQGQVTYPALIPGATYRVYDNTQLNAGGRQLRREFVARGGEVIDLGDIVIAKPES